MTTGEYSGMFTLFVPLIEAANRVFLLMNFGTSVKASRILPSISSWSIKSILFSP
ncbi:MAG: hypothetical protein ACI9YB_001646 [Halioglobus sp.]|jgi:hypothetical protein